MDDLPALRLNLQVAVKAWSMRSFDEQERPLVLLPISDVSDQVAAWETLTKDLGEIASELSIYLAGAAENVVNAEGHACCKGFLIDNSGAVQLEFTKLSPDLVHGFRDGGVLPTGVPATFPVAKTPFGQIGLLIGEDILFAHYARSLAFSGAEIILHPTKEQSDNLFHARQNARYSRAFENAAFVITASAKSSSDGVTGQRRPTTSGVVNWLAESTSTVGEEDFIFPDVDIQKLRRRRNGIVGMQPLHLRANLYAEGFARLTKEQGASDADVGQATRSRWIEQAKRRVAGNLIADRPTNAIDQYDVILTQNVKKIIQRENDVETLRRENILNALKLPARLASNPAVKLVVLGEFFMTGQGGHGYRSPVTLQRLAVRYPGPELELLQNFALKHKTYVAGSSFEIDDRLPGHVFNSAFIINDSGDLIHRYRKIQCADVWGSLPDTTPSSIYDRYLDVYGYDYLFPVANTPLGRLATMVCFDMVHPEIARMLTKHGAEVLIHPSSEGHGVGRAAWDRARLTRAYENTAYLLTALPGAVYFDPDDSGGMPSTQMRGHSKIINFDGTVQAVADTSGPCILQGTIDLKSLRRARANPLTNIAVWDDPAVYQHIYAGNVGLPNNLWGSDPMQNPYVGFKPLKAVLNSYYERGIFVPPEGGATAAVPFSSRVWSPPQSASSLTDLKKMNGDFLPI